MLQGLGGGLLSQSAIGPQHLQVMWERWDSVRRRRGVHVYNKVAASVVLLLLLLLLRVEAKVGLRLGWAR